MVWIVLFPCCEPFTANTRGINQLQLYKVSCQVTPLFWQKEKCCKRWYIRHSPQEAPRIKTNRAREKRERLGRDSGACCGGSGLTNHNPGWNRCNSLGLPKASARSKAVMILAESFQAQRHKTGAWGGVLASLATLVRAVPFVLPHPAAILDIAHPLHVFLRSCAGFCSFGGVQLVLHHLPLLMP